MNDIKLPPPNLAALGLKRRTSIAPDLYTIWKSPYPVLTNTRRVCEASGIEIYNGGTWTAQGEPDIGYITSGYRDEVIEGRHNSPHRFALAVDIVIGSINEQIRVAKIAKDYFMRIGIYDSGFMHWDLCNLEWIKKYNGRRYWCRFDGVYTSFDDFDKLIEHVAA